MLPIEHMYEDMRPLLQAARPEDAFQALRNVVAFLSGFRRSRTTTSACCTTGPGTGRRRWGISSVPRTSTPATQRS